MEGRASKSDARKNMNFAIEKIKQALDDIGVVAVPDEDPNKLYVVFDFEETRLAIMMSYSEDAKMMFIMAEIPVEIPIEKEESAFLAAAYINRELNFGSATYLSDINRIVFKFYFSMEKENPNLGMFDYCYYDAIDLVQKYYPIISLLEKGAVLPKDVVAMAES